MGPVLVLLSCSDPCDNVETARVTSPQGGHDAVVFRRDCGATTGFSTHVTILPTGKPLANRAGNAFTADSNHGAAPESPDGGPEVSVEWLSEKRLLVLHHRSARTFLSASHAAGVDVSYAILDQLDSPTD